MCLRARCRNAGLCTKVPQFLQFSVAHSTPPNLRIFADDSVVGHIAVYGLIGNMSGLLDACIQILSEEKARFGINSSVPLHCKDMYAGDARKDGPWAHLAHADVIELFSSLANNLADSIKPLVSLGYMDLRSIPRQIKVTASFPESPKVTVKLPLEKDRKKQALAFAFGAAIKPFQSHCSIPTEDCLVTIGSDRTKIEWFNSGKQAHYAAAAWGQDFRIEVKQTDPLLELADMIAYHGGQVLAATAKKGYSQKILSVLQPRIWQCSFLPALWELQPTNYPPNRRVLAKVEDVTLKISLS